MSPTFAQIESLYLNSYGTAYKVNMSMLKKINLCLAIVIVGLYPVPLALVINKLLPKKYILRLNK